MEDITSTPSGKETVAEIHEAWDDTSKEALWSQPSIMATIHEQRESGIYDVIKAEMDRQITLGTIKPNVPFLEAYKTVGDQLVEQAQSQNGGKKQDVPTPVVHRAATPKSDVANSDKAKAASTTRTTPKAAQVYVNPLAQSDAEFLKSMEGRV